MRQVSLHLDIREIDNDFLMEIGDHLGSQRDPDRTIKRIVAEGDSAEAAVTRLMEAVKAETLDRLGESSPDEVCGQCGEARGNSLHLGQGVVNSHRFKSRGATA